MSTAASRRVRRVASQLRPASCADVCDDDDAAFERYCREGEARARELGNRGPLRFQEDGRLATDILEAYTRQGFYVFENVIAEEELQDLCKDFETVLDTAPASPGSKLDKHGRTVPHPDKIYQWVKPLSDPLGGTPFAVFNFAGGETKGRHHLKMRTPSPRPGSPEVILQGLNLPLVTMPSAMRALGHPDLLRIAESINGDDFVPHGLENLWHKPAFGGTSTAWHQDPSSAWDEKWSEPGFDPNSCGFNMHVALTDCVPGNALWAVPASNRAGRVDICALSASGDASDRLPGAIPLLCRAGDVYIHSRTTLHGAFANTSAHTRLTLQFGFHRRSSVRNIKTRGFMGAARFGADNPMVCYDDSYIQERCKMFMWAIDARRQRFPEKAPYVYKPFQGRASEFLWSPEFAKDEYGSYHKRNIAI